MSELLVHILIDNNLCVPTKPDILTPSFSIYTGNFKNLDWQVEDISDSSYFNRHKKKELVEKKTKNRATEIYRHQLHSQQLMQSSCMFDNYSSRASSNSEKSVEIDDYWYKNFLQNKEKPLYRVGIFNGEELWSIDQDLLEKLVKSKEIQSDYLPANSPIEVPDQTGFRSSRRKAYT